MSRSRSRTRSRTNNRRNPAARIERLEMRSMMASDLVWNNPNWDSSLLGTTAKVPNAHYQSASVDVNLDIASNRFVIGKGNVTPQLPSEFQFVRNVGSSAEVVESKVPLTPSIIASLASVPGVAYTAPVFVTQGSQSEAVLLNEVIVSLKPGVSPESFFARSAQFSSYRNLEGTSDQYVATVKNGYGRAALDVGNDTANDPAVQWVAPNFYQNWEKYYTPNDPLFPAQWSANNFGQAGGKADADVDLTEAWNVNQGGASNIAIAVIDDGIESTHPDINIWTNPGETNFDGIDNDGNGWIDDVHGWNFVADTNQTEPVGTDQHGTSAAGVAAARGDNLIGVAGAAYNSQVMSLKVFENNTSASDAGIASAIYYAAGRTKNGLGTWKSADIVTNAWGGGVPSAIINSALAWGTTNGRQGVGTAYVFGTGNSFAASISEPAAQSLNIPGVIAVGASNNFDNRSVYSNYGAGLDFVAPSNDFTPTSVGISTTDRVGVPGYVTGDYTSLAGSGFGGTSSAASLASGVGALVLAQADVKGVSVSPSQLQKLLRNATDLIGGASYDVITGKNVEYGYGRLNAAAAVLGVDQPEISVLDSKTDLPNRANVGFDSAVVFQFSELVLRIRNQGTKTLNLSGVTVTGPFGLQGLGANTLGVGESTTLTLRFLPTATGSFFGKAIIGSNDSDESAFELNLFGSTVTASISGTVFEDYNGNGVFESFERFLTEEPNDFAYLDENDDGIWQNTETRVPITNGGYKFENLVPRANDYIVRTQEPNWTLTQPLKNRYGVTISNTNDSITGKNFGYSKNNRLYSYVYEEINENNNLDPGEPPLSGVTVEGIDFSYIKQNLNQVNIPDRSSASLSVNVTDQGTVDNLRLRLNIDHTFDADLTITLTAPDGTILLLANGVGGSQDNFNATLFDDTAFLSITQGNAPFAGAFRPQDSFSLLKGKDIFGIWTVTVTDTKQFDTGVLKDITLDFNRRFYGVSDQNGWALVDLPGGETNPVFVVPPPTWRYSNPSGGFYNIFPVGLPVYSFPVPGLNNTPQGLYGIFRTNVPPTDLLLSNSNVDENLPVTSLVGNLSSIDPNRTLNTFTYTLTPGIRPYDNAFFKIVGDKLVTNAIFNFEAKSSYLIHVRTTDAGGQFLEKEFTININDLPDPSASISGTVFEDFNGNGIFESFERVVQQPGMFVYIDDNDDGSWQATERQITVTNGLYNIDGLANGVFVVRANVPGWTFNSPIQNRHVVSLPTDTSVLTGKDFSYSKNDRLYSYVYEEINQDGILNPGEPPLPGYTVSGVDQVGPVFSAAGIAIPDNGTVSSTINVVGQGTIEQVVVRVNITHPWDSDLKLSLVGPDGTTVILAQNVGADGDNFVGTVFSDAAATSINAGTAPFTGTFRPSQALSAFNTKPLQGAWKLSIEDGKPLDIGVLNNWSLTFQRRFSGISDANGWALVDLPPGETNVMQLSTPQPGWAYSRPITGAYTITAPNAPVFGTEYGLFHNNVSPTSLSLSNSSVAENLPLSTLVGTFSSVDPNRTGNTFTYTLVAGLGPNDNQFFKIVGDQLQTNATFNFEAKSSYSIRVRTTDAGVPPQFLEKDFTISIIDVPDPSASITGTVFEDFDHDGVFDSFERVVQQPGSFVYIDDNNDGILQGTERQFLIVNGLYTIDALAARDYVLRAVVPGWTVVQPSKSRHLVTVPSDTANVTAINYSFAKNDRMYGYVYEEINRDGVLNPGEPPLPGYTLSAVDQYIQTNNNGLAIPDATTASSSTVMSSMDITEQGTIESLQVVLNINHAWDADLKLTLIAPDGTRVVLAQNVGGNFGGVNFVNTRFSDTAATSINAGSAPFTGAFRPQNVLSALNNKLVAGTWKLEITDSKPFDVGSLVNWTLDFQRRFSGVSDANGWALVDLPAGETNNIQLSTPQPNWSYSRPATGFYTVTATNTPVFDLQYGLFHENESPTDILLNPSTVDENQPLGTLVGTLTSVDPNRQLNTFTYAFVAGPNDNGFFTLTGDKIFTNSTFNYEARTSYSVTVRTTDGGGLSFTRNITININDLPDPVASISGVVFEDFDGDSVLDTFERPVTQSGTYVFIDDNDDGIWEPSEKREFTVNGNYTFTPMITGIYLLRTFLPGWTVNTPIKNRHFVRVLNDFDPVPNVDFSFSKNDRQYSFVYEEINENGVADPGEPPLPGFLIDSVAQISTLTSPGAGGAIADPAAAAPPITTVFPINVTQIGLIENLIVQVNIAHPFDSDLTLTLIGPDGQTVTLANRNGADGDNFANTIFDDTAATSIAAGTAPFAGSFRPITPLSVFFKTRMEGQWRLAVTDSKNSDVGSLASWNLQFQYTNNNFRNTTPARIPPTQSKGTTVSTISIPSTEVIPDLGRVVDVTVSVNITHTYNSDLKLSLISPDGTEILLADSVGTDTDNFGSANVKTRFSDAGPIGINAGTAPYLGVFKPAQALAGFKGKKINGDWKLKIEDTKDIDSGTLNDWSLDFRRQPEAISDQNGWALLDLEPASVNDEKITLQPDWRFSFPTTGTYQVTTTGVPVFDKPFGLFKLNVAPTDLILSDHTIAENQPIGTFVGTLTTVDPNRFWNTFTYTFVTGAGSTDNALFRINGDKLETNATFDFQTKTSFSIRIQTTDAGTPALSFEKQLTIDVLPLEIRENQPIGTLVGLYDSSGTGSFVVGAGSTDNNSYSISNNSLLSRSVFDFESKSVHSVRISSLDDVGAVVEKVYSVRIIDVDEAPTSLSLSNNSIPENSGIGFLVGNFSATDPDAGDTFTFSLVPGAGDTGNASFRVQGNQLRTNQDFNFEAQNVYSIRARVTDRAGFTFERTFTINITNVNEKPTIINLSGNLLPENTAPGFLIGLFSHNDPDASEVVTYELVNGVGPNDNALFKIQGDQLVSAVVLDFEISRPYTIEVRGIDKLGLFAQTTFTIIVTDVQEKPYDIIVSPSEVLENEPADTIVGNVSAFDQDAGDTYTLSMVSGPGDTDNGSFKLVGSTLKTNASFDFEAKRFYSIRIRATDSTNLVFEKILQVSVLNENEIPLSISLTPPNVNENLPVGTVVGTLTTQDTDAGDTYTYRLLDDPANLIAFPDNTQFSIENDQLKTNAVFDFDVKKTYTLRLISTDQGGLSVTQVIIVTVNNVNDPPTDIGVTNLSIPENQPTDTLVGTLSTVDNDDTDTFTYTLVNGAGASDNSNFKIVGKELRTNRVLDFELQKSHSIRIESRDSGGLAIQKVFVIDVTNVNETPTSLLLSKNNVNENSLLDTLVGALSTTDPDAGESFTYSFVSGAGSTDNSKFKLVDSILRTNASLDFETKPSYSIRVKSTDVLGLSIESIFTINVNDINEAPFNFNIANNLLENTAIGTKVGTASATDVDANDTLKFALVTGIGGEDNTSFSLSQTGDLQLLQPLDFETKKSYNILARVQDFTGLFLDKAFVLSVVDVNETPTAVGLSNSSVPENSGSGAVVGDLTTVDQDAGDSFTYSLVSGVGADDNANFTIVGNQLVTNADFDFETKKTYLVRVKSSDSGLLSIEQELTIAISDVNEAPTLVALDNLAIPENKVANSLVGLLSTTDVDANEAFTYSLVDGAGSADNASFSIVNNRLEAKVPFDFETKNSYQVRVRSTDRGGLPTENAFVIQVQNANDLPSNIALSNQTVDENTTTNVLIGLLSASDQDVGDTISFRFVSGKNDNSNFELGGATKNELRLPSAFNFEQKSSYVVEVQAIDQSLNGTTMTFTITVNNVNDPVTNVLLTSTEIDENVAINSTVGQLSALDEDTVDPHTFTLVNGFGSADNSKFSIVGNQLQLTDSPNFEVKSSYSILVQGQDQAGTTFQKNFTISVRDLPETPTNLVLSSNSIKENSASNAQIGTLNASDPDVGSLLTFALVTGSGSTDNASFAIVGNKLNAKSSYNFESKSSYLIRVRATDQTNRFVENTFTISIEDVNEAPTGIEITKSTVDENKPAGSTVGIFNTVDPDFGETFAYSLVPTATTGDNAKFTIVGNELRTNEKFNFEGKASYQLTIRSQDSKGASFEIPLTVRVNDILELPPVALDESAKTPADLNVTINVLANDTSTDSPIDPSTVTIVSPPLEGTVRVLSDGRIEYSPPVGRFLNTSFSYTVKNANDVVSNVANVSVTVYSAFQNQKTSLDVDADGSITPLDVLTIINDINANGLRTLPTGIPDSAPYLDTNGNGQTDPLDALEVINYINTHLPGNAEGESSSQAVDEVFGAMSDLSVGTRKSSNNDNITMLAIDEYYRDLEIGRNRRR